MAKHSVSQMQLGEKLGLSQVAISRRLSGRVPFDVNELQQVAEMFGLSMGDLVAS